VRFIDDDQVPLHGLNLGGARGGEVIGADDNLIPGLERREVARPARGVVGLGFQDGGRERELLQQFLLPLLPEGGGNDDQQPAAALGPRLAQDQARLDGFAEAHLVGEEHALG